MEMRLTPWRTSVGRVADSAEFAPGSDLSFVYFIKITDSELIEAY